MVRFGMLPLRVPCLVVAALGAALAFAACGPPERDLPSRPTLPPPDNADAGDDFEAGIGAGGGPPAADAGGLCGNEIHQAVVDAPNLYFVLDASGSMATPSGSASLNRYDAVRVAVVDLVRKLGPLVRVGAAVFPRHVTDTDSCHAGDQVMPVAQGDPITGTDGPTTTALRLTTVAKPVGGTPVSATLKALTPVLTSLPGKTFVILATDGGPNCNEAASCDAAHCITNIENMCQAGVNCCESGLDGPALCIDQDATVAAITTLAQAGVQVLVIGIPGSETYSDVLDAMAKAGGSPHVASPYYYPVAQVDGLSSVLGAIASIAVKCDFTLVDPPADPGMTNVYFDQKMLPYGAPDGWVWKPPATVSLNEDACNDLKAGKVKQVQIVSGCPTGKPN
jgi:hypothetical protein